MFLALASHAGLLGDQTHTSILLSDHTVHPTCPVVLETADEGRHGNVGRHIQCGRYGLWQTHQNIICVSSPRLVACQSIFLLVFSTVHNLCCLARRPECASEWKCQQVSQWLLPLLVCSLEPYPKAFHKGGVFCASPCPLCPLKLSIPSARKFMQN